MSQKRDLANSPPTVDTSSNVACTETSPPPKKYSTQTLPNSNLKIDLIAAVHLVKVSNFEEDGIDVRLNFSVRHQEDADRVMACKLAGACGKGTSARCVHEEQVAQVITDSIAARTVQIAKLPTKTTAEAVKKFTDSSSTMVMIGKSGASVRTPANVSIGVLNTKRHSPAFPEDAHSRSLNNSTNR
ncbi:hypothetical protein BG004_005791 [Podila humilis]|nr:hypothetical protein BG004_005791 [Podila humilis]